jgi:hypothetical protein
VEALALAQVQAQHSELELEPGLQVEFVAVVSRFPRFFYPQ